jgi:dihydrofolate reductase
MIRHIVAIDSFRGIAKNGEIPWNLPADARHFAELTKSHGGIMLMGRETYDYIGEALPGRQSFVLTRNPDFQAEGVTAVHDLDAFLREQADVWIIGGSALYAMTLQYAEELYITEIEHDYGCDTFYPMYRSAFELASEGELMTEQGQAVTFRFNLYKPRKT